VKLETHYFAAESTRLACSCRSVLGQAVQLYRRVVLPEAPPGYRFFDAFSARPVRSHAAAGRWRLSPRATRSTAP